MPLLRTAAALAALTIACVPASAGEDEPLISDCDANYYAFMLAAGPDVAQFLPADLPPGLAPQRPAGLHPDRIWAAPAAELRQMCVADATAHPDVARFALAAGLLSSEGGIDPVPWYRRAADLGEPLAMVPLSRLLREADPDDAHRWAVRAAAAGSPAGTYVLGENFELGVGVAADLARATELYERSAVLGWWGGAYRLAQLSSDRPAAASAWYDRAAALSHAPTLRARILIEHAETVWPGDPARGSRLVIAALATGSDEAIDWVEGSAGEPNLQPMFQAIEDHLIAEGWLSGTADGVISGQTMVALRAWQQSIKVDLARDLRSPPPPLRR